MIEILSSRAKSTLLAALMLALPESGASATPPSMFSDSATTLVVEVPVLVLRDGAPVRGLEVDDFELTQDGVQQTIVGFERVDLSLTHSADPDAGELPTSLASRRYFLFVFDLSHTHPILTRRAVAAARDLLDDGLHPSDLAGVGVYSSVAGARLLHPFTADHQQVEGALRAVELVTYQGAADDLAIPATSVAVDEQENEAVQQFLGEIRQFRTQQRGGLISVVGPAGEALASMDSSGRGAMANEILVDMETDYQKNIANVIRDHALAVVETLGEVAAALEGVRGQKYFVLFSEGMDETIFDNWLDGRAASRFARVLDSFRRSGWVVQSIDVGRQDGFDRGMSLLALETGGSHYGNFNDLSDAMERMLAQTSVSYVLSFQPAEVVLDGGYHQIEVRLRSPQGRQVKHRHGYFAPLPSSGRAFDDLVAMSDRAASFIDGGPFEVAAMATPFKLDDSTALVPAVIEIDGPGLLERHGTGLFELQIDAYLLGEHSGATALSSQRLAVDPAIHGPVVLDGGIKVFGDLLLPAGKHRLRFVVHDTGLDRRSVATLTVTVPDYGSGTPILLPPFFPETSGAWLPVRMRSGGADPDAPFPYQFATRKFMPQVGVTIARGETVPVCVMAFDVPAPDPGLKLALVAADGSRPPAGHLRIVSAPEITENGLFRVMAELDSTGLESGEYELRVSQRDGASGTSVESSRLFLVQ